MNANRSDEDYDEVVQRAKSGEILVGVDRAFARQLYTSIPVQRFREFTGESPYTEKFVVIATLAASLVALLVSAFLAALEINWWAVLVIPVGGLGWFSFYSKSSLGRADLTGISILVVIVFVLFLPCWQIQSARRRPRRRCLTIARVKLPSSP